MADFTYATACARAVAKVADKTWINAFVCRQSVANSKIAVRLQRPMGAASAGARQNGGWVEVTDDASV